MEINCTPTQFESAIKSLCERMGLSVQLTQASHDGGVDLNVIDPTPIRGGHFIIQAKRYQGGVGEPIIRDLYGTLLHSGAVKAILITTGYFTEGAVTFAIGKPIELVDGDALRRLIEQFQLHHEFSGEANSPNSHNPLTYTTADDLLTEYARKPNDNLFSSILGQLCKEERHTEIVEFGAQHWEQLFSLPSQSSTYFQSLLIADRIDILPMALKQLWNLHFDLLLPVLANSIFLLVPKERIQRVFAEAIQSVVQTTGTDPAKYKTLTKAFLLLDDRPRSLEWLKKTMQLEPDNAECLSLLAAYNIVKGEYPAALTHLTRSIQANPRSFAAIYNYHAARLALREAYVQFDAASERWSLLCKLTDNDLTCPDEVLDIEKNFRRSILEEILKGDPHNLAIREALLALLPYEQQITLGEDLAYEIDEESKGTRVPTNIAGILQAAYFQQARENTEERQKAKERGIQWTEFLIKAGVRDVDTLYVGAMLMFDPDDKSQVAALLKDHVDVVLANSTLTSLYCNSLDHKDAISILEQVLSTRRLSLTKEELNGIHWELAIHYENIGEVDKAISMYKLATNFNDKDALMIYLFRVRQLKGNPTAYQEALRLLAENGETLATLCGIAQECFFNELYTDELRYLKKAITLAPNDADICSDLAFTYKMLDQEKEAAYWEKKVTLLAGV